MNFWIPGASDPGVDRDYEDEGVYLVNDTQNRISIEQQVLHFMHKSYDTEKKSAYL